MCRNTWPATSNVSRPMPVTDTSRPITTNSGMTPKLYEAMAVSADLAIRLPATLMFSLIIQTETKDRPISTMATCMPAWISRIINTMAPRPI